MRWGSNVIDDRGWTTLGEREPPKPLNDSSERVGDRDSLPPLLGARAMRFEPNCLRTRGR